MGKNDVHRPLNLTVEQRRQIQIDNVKRRTKALKKKVKQDQWERNRIKREGGR